METKGLRSPLSKCECLTLDTCIQVSVLPGIASLLESSSHLETLVITVSSRNKEDYWTSPKRTFQCLMLHLKIVKLTGSVSYYHHFDFSFVQFLLKNARVLQKMVINTQREDYRPQKELFQAAQKFLSFPRSSPDAVVMFN